jgi:hypothetical protein
MRAIVNDCLMDLAKRMPTKGPATNAGDYNRERDETAVESDLRDAASSLARACCLQQGDQRKRKATK